MLQAKQYLGWMAEIIQVRIRQIMHADESFENIQLPSPPDMGNLEDNLSVFTRQHDLSNEERMLLILALLPHVDPGMVDHVIQKNISQSADFPQMGGVRGKNFRGFLPTGETALFLLAGSDLERRWEMQKLFDSDHFFARNRILWLEEVPHGEPAMSGRIILAEEYVESFTTGRISKPHFSSNFPAKRIYTELEWGDLVLSEDVMQQIRELESWLKHNHVLMIDWGMKHRLKKGYRVLFHGPPGTGKTFTATLLGKYTGKDVYKIDLSMVVSKYIGETEKNLENLFTRAETKEWILFFDEADALFGKRTNVRDAHDKYANQEVSYLLQRIEDFDGLVILASNMKNNIDDAFIRRFNAIIKFSLPNEQERMDIWQKSFPSAIGFQDGMNIPELVKKFELTGGNINNVVHFACLKTIEKKKKQISLEDVVYGIQREMHKEGKPFVNMV